MGRFSNHRTSFLCVQFSQTAIAIRQLLILERDQEVFWSFHWCKFWKLELEILHPGLCLGWPVAYTLHRMWDKRQFSESSCTKVWVGYKWFFWPCLVAIQSFNKAQIAVNWIAGWWTMSCDLIQWASLLSSGLSLHVSCVAQCGAVCSLIDLSFHTLCFFST
jgi:hypothetical protein